jgi:homoserine O-acetyltransferase
MQALATGTVPADKFNAEAAVRATGLDANDFLYSLKSSADCNPEPRIRTRVFALNFDDDEFNPELLQILGRLRSRVPNGRYVVQLGSMTSFGHLTMAYPELWSQHVAELRWLAGRP